MPVQDAQGDADEQTDTENEFEDCNDNLLPAWGGEVFDELVADRDDAEHCSEAEPTEGSED